MKVMHSAANVDCYLLVLGSPADFLMTCLPAPVDATITLIFTITAHCYNNNQKKKKKKVTPGKPLSCSNAFLWLFRGNAVAFRNTTLTK